MTWRAKRATFPGEIGWSNGGSNTVPPSGQSVAKSGENALELPTQGNSTKPGISASPDEPPGTEDADEAVERALAAGLSAATAAGRFDIVAQLARELEARRCLRAGNVVPLERKRPGAGQ